MSLLTDALHILTCFGLSGPLVRLQPLGGAGGMSGADLWQVRARDELFCLRRWPAEHPSADALAWIHQQLRRAVTAGCDFVPLPLPTPDGQTFVRHAGHLWELSEWMPGRADFHLQPTHNKLIAALRALARFHQATADAATDRPGRSPGLEVRWLQLQSTTPQRLSTLNGTLDAAYGPQIQRLAQQVLQLVPQCLQSARTAVAAARDLITPTQPCIRDIWHDHVLYQGERVSGFIDFGAMRIETPVGDIARLLGSLVGNDPQRWREGLAAYEEVRPVTDDQRRLLAAFDAANITLAGLNWIDWLYVQRRQFRDLDQVAGRLAEICRRAECFAEHDWPPRDGL
jgi:homoserine kinase type II